MGCITPIQILHTYSIASQFTSLLVNGLTKACATNIDTANLWASLELVAR